MTPWGIEPATFRLVTQYLIQLPYRVPHKVNGWTQKFRSGCIKLQGVHTKVTEWTHKFRSGHKISGWTESFAVHTVSGGHKVTACIHSSVLKKRSVVEKVSMWIQSFGVDTQLRHQCILRKGIRKLLNYQVSPDISSETATFRQP